jgi:hypothetical protein
MLIDSSNSISNNNNPNCSKMNPKFGSTLSLVTSVHQPSQTTMTTSHGSPSSTSSQSSSSSKNADNMLLLSTPPSSQSSNQTGMTTNSSGSTSTDSSSGPNSSRIKIVNSNYLNNSKVFQTVNPSMVCSQVSASSKPSSLSKNSFQSSIMYLKSIASADQNYSNHNRQLGTNPNTCKSLFE